MLRLLSETRVPSISYRRDLGQLLGGPVGTYHHSYDDNLRERKILGVGKSWPLGPEILLNLTAKLGGTVTALNIGKY